MRHLITTKLSIENTVYLEHEDLPIEHRIIEPIDVKTIGTIIDRTDAELITQHLETWTPLVHKPLCFILNDEYGLDFIALVEPAGRLTLVLQENFLSEITRITIFSNVRDFDELIKSLFKEA